MLMRPAGKVPRLGFLGLGWIGRQRMQALQDAEAVEVVALADPDPAAVKAAAELAPEAAQGRELDTLLAAGVDGVVIATPSALHAEQAIAALAAGCAVFCQKPLARSGAEAAKVVAAAREADRRLGVDLSYRHTAALRALKTEIDEGRLGTVHLVDLTFHNAYGPDKPWFRDRALSGGGCLMNLGTHLADAALWLTGAAGAKCLTAALFHEGRRLTAAGAEVEDLALATLELPGGAIARIACSWNLPAGCDAVIRLEAFGSGGGAGLRNLGASFYDFEACRYEGTRSAILVSPPDPWGGRALVDWAQALAESAGFDPEAERLVGLSHLIDEIYAAALPDRTLPAS